MGLFSFLFGSEDKKETSKGRGRPRTNPVVAFERKSWNQLQPSLNFPAHKKEIFIDGEWSYCNPDGKREFYLLGYTYDLHHTGWLYGDMLNKYNIRKLFDGCSKIYFYGPDIGQLEAFFGISLKNRYCCINLLKAMHDLEPYRQSYRLCDIEKSLGIHRQTMEYKRDIANLHRDWYGINGKYQNRKRALQYNREDVINLIRVKRELYRKHRVTPKQELNWQLK